MRSTVTSKGQITLPKALRDEFAIHPGVKVEFIKDSNGNIQMVPITRSIFDLKGILHTDKHFTIEELNEGVMEAVSRTMDNTL